MLRSIKAFFADKMQPAPSPDAPADEDRVRLAACALLVELAHADNEFSPAERAHLESALVRHFGVSPETVGELIALAETQNAGAIDHFQFTSLIASHYDLGQKTLLAEIMWGLVAADGQIAEHEAYLVRKMSNFLNLEPGYLYAAKQRAVGARDS